MRIFLAGDGDPIPLEALPDLTDLGNAISLVLPNGVDFHKADYIALGFTHYEVMCVGGAGGRAGKSNFRFQTPNLTYEIFSMGGSGGGGGFEMVTGALADLPDACAVVVGAAGVDGANGVYSYGAYGGSDGHGALDRGHLGLDGGPSTFGATLCRASGGKGGKPPQANNNQAVGSGNDAIRTVFFPDGHAESELRAGGEGGRGGKGGQTAAGGGALGGTSIEGGYNPAVGNHGNTPQVLIPPENGPWDGHIGQGGGGGMGGSFGLDVTQQLIQFSG